MELRKLSPADMEQVRKVWKTCFQDSDAFINTYFSTAVSITDGMGFFDGSRLLSDLFTFSLEANVSGMVYPSEFIAGCATLPEARNQHLMHDLIQAALADMASRSICVCFLHPFMHSFYRKFGFETVAYVDRRAASKASPAPSNIHIASSLDDVPIDSLYTSYRAYVSQYGSHFMRTRSRMEAWLKVLFADGGKMVYLEAPDSTPYALFYSSQDETDTNDIFELVYFKDDQLQALLQSTGLDANYFLPTRRTDRNASEFTMMRVIDPLTVLRWYRYAPGTSSFVINIHDGFLSKDYNVEVVPGETEAQITEVEKESDIVADITDIATFCTGTYDPREFPQCRDIFQPSSACYFETY